MNFEKTINENGNFDIVKIEIRMSTKKAKVITSM